MGWKNTVRSATAAARATERDSRRRQRELERRQPLMAHAGELKRSAFASERQQNHLARLATVHHDCSGRVDWAAMAAAPEPVALVRAGKLEAAALSRRDGYQPGFADMLFGREQAHRRQLQDAVDFARAKDEAEHGRAMEAFRRARDDWRDGREMALRVLSHEPQALLEALQEANPFAEIAELGSDVLLEFRSDHPGAIFAEIRVNGASVMPKALPAADASRIYRDYVCGIALRVGREIAALLPLDPIHVTAVDPQQVLSVQVVAATVRELDVARLDPVEGIRRFVHAMAFAPAAAARGESTEAEESLSF